MFRGMFISDYSLALTMWMAPSPKFRTFMQLATRLVLAASVVLAPSVCVAQQVPSANEIFARHVEAIGGKDAVMQVSSIQTTGKVEVPGTGIAGTMEAFYAPNRSVTRTTIPGVGEIATGFDGSVAWEVNPMQGPRIKSEKETAAMKEDANFYSNILYASDRYQSAETVGVIQFGGESAWQVNTVLKSGRTVNEYFSVETGLHVGSQTTQVSNAGSVNVVSVESNYRQFGALKRPTRSEVTTGARKMVVTVDDVVLGLVPASTFELPDPVKALVRTQPPNERQRQ